MKILLSLAFILLALLLAAKVVGIVVLLWTGAAGRGPFLVKQAVYAAGLGGVLVWLWQARERLKKAEPQDGADGDG